MNTTLIFDSLYSNRIKDNSFVLILIILEYFQNYLSGGGIIPLKSTILILKGFRYVHIEKSELAVLTIYCI